MSSRTTNALVRCGIEQISTLKKLKDKEYDFQEIKGIGLKCSKEIAFAMKNI